MRKYPIVVLLSLSSALAQTRPSFDVASIKPAAPCCASGQARVDFPIPKASHDRVDFRYVTLRYCIAFAFRIADYQLSGPSWLADANFDIEAKAPPGTRDAQLADMLQALLAERFGLQIHRETKNVSALALVKTSDSPKLKESPVASDDPGPSFGTTMTYTGIGKMQVKRASMTEFAQFLSSSIHRPVVDMTGMNGRYDLDPSFSNEDTRGTEIASLRGVPEPAESGTSIYTSIKEFGLKLEARRAPLDMIVVDRVNRTPTEN